ncbi:MAG: hypothetical protein NC177_12475 [Ruminococcus flavefaciens]|nr:hypothetical protein [Ruminococcus flavefaciens]
MENEYIDVDWTECEDDTQSGNKNMTICTDPLSAVVSSICGVADNITNAIKEYNMCRQQEETKRSEIKACLKLGLAEIKAKKEVILTQMNNEHELKIQFIQNYHEVMSRELDMVLETTRTAIEIAKEQNDMSGLIELMKVQSEISRIYSQSLLEHMDKTISQNNLSERIAFSQDKKYLE